MSHQLGLQHITQQFKQAGDVQIILHDASYTFEQGKSYAITGPSGSGKSTLLHLLAGLDVPTSGAIVYDEKNIAHFTTHEHEQYLYHGLGLIFQVPYLIDELTVLENTMLKGLIGAIPAEEAQRRAYYLLERVGLRDKSAVRPAQLSGGEQQRVALARALFTQPAFILADEPTAHVDSIHRDILIQLLNELVQEHKIGLILVTHDAAVMTMVDEVLRIEDKKLVRV